VTKARPDRRVLPRRVPFMEKCVVEMPSGEPRETTLVNLNMVGGYVASNNSPALGERVVLRFKLPPNDIAMALTGIVMWVNDRGPSPGQEVPPGFGVQFVATSLEDAAALLRFVEENAAKAVP
jgi:Tfp pilus assembly protein PilZ